MAAAGEGTAATAGYDGGAGGKFRKRPFRQNQRKPYDRPPTAVRNPNWLTKVVFDPASKLIASSAQRFLPFIFRKSLPAPPTPLPGPHQEAKNLPQESCPNGSIHPPVKDYSGALVMAGREGNNAAGSYVNSAFSELEQLLKQKTFTRTEIDRLTELLRSKAVDMPNEEKRAELIQSRFALDSSSSLPEENNCVKVASGVVVPAPVASSRVLEDDIASPAELAKAYMGSRPSKVSPSMLSTRSQVMREDTPLIKNTQGVQKSPIPYVKTRSTSLLGVRENGLSAPRSHGRSAIYNMARTPYSRFRQADVQKATSLTNYGYGGSSSYQLALEHGGPSGSKKALKRRSYVLDDDIGSVGPIRRIKQKPNLLPYGVLHPSGGVGDDQDNKATPSRHVAIPPKSSETAAKILEHLEKMTPKGKSSESKLAAGKENKLTPNMLQGRALRSLEDLDSSKLLQSAENCYKLENCSKVLPPSTRESKQSEIEQNGRKSFGIESTVVSKNDTSFSFKDAQPVEIRSVDNNSTAQSPPKKQAFKMSAHEYSFEVEDDMTSNGPSSQEKGSGKLEISAAGQKSLFAAEPMSKPPALLEAREPHGGSDKKEDLGTPETGAAAIKDTISESAVTQSLDSNPLATACTNAKETNADKVSSFLSSSPASFTRSKPGSMSSLSNLASSQTDNQSIPVELDNSLEAVDSNGKLSALSSGSSSSISSSGIYSFAAASSSSSLSNGLFAPTPAISVASALASNNITNDVSTSSLSGAAPSISIASTIDAKFGSSPSSASNLFGSCAAASVSKEPLIKFSSSGPLPEMVSPPSVPAAGNTGMKAKSETESTFGNIKSSTLASASLASTGSGTGVFGFSSSVMSTVTTSSTQSQGSFVSTGGTTPVSVQTSVAGLSGSMPSLFSSSASSSSMGNIAMFGSAPGTTGQVSASSNSNLAGSSSGASGIFTFGASTTASSAANCSTGDANKAAPSLFRFGMGSAGTSSETSVPATSSGASSGIFSFSGSSSASSTNALNVSSSTTPSIFKFSGNFSSSANAISTSATTSILGGGSSLSSPMSAVNASTGAAPAIFNFGFNSSASSTNAGSTVNPNPFSGSPFGFSSSFSSSTSAGVMFGSSSSLATPSTSPVIFRSTPSAPAGSPFQFGVTSAISSSQSMFVNSASTFAVAHGNNDNMEDSMAEDPVMASSPAVSFAQPSASPSPGLFGFNSTASPFQFGNQQSQAPQNPSPFAASSSGLEFSAGGSFSLGSTGTDKSGRKIIKVNRNKNRRKGNHKGNDI